MFTRKQDIEIAGLFAAVLAWGQRATIIRKCAELVSWMDNDPHRFILHHSRRDLRRFEAFRHRTFNGTDALYFIEALQSIYRVGAVAARQVPSTQSRSRSPRCSTLSNWRPTFIMLARLWRPMRERTLAGCARNPRPQAACWWR